MEKNDLYDVAEDFIWFRFKWGLIVYEKDGSYTREILEHYGMTGTGKE